MSTITYLDRLLEPVAGAFTKEFAEVVVNLRVEAAMEQHVDELRHKANQGNLTPDEERDYKAFVEAVDIIGVIQSKARRFLARPVC